MAMLIRLDMTTIEALRARAAALGCDQSEVARRALRRHRRNPCSIAALRASATRSGSMPVHLDLGDTADGMGASKIRAILAAQLVDTEPLVTWSVHEYRTVDEAEGRE